MEPAERSVLAVPGRDLNHEAFLNSRIYHTPILNPAVANYTPGVAYTYAAIAGTSMTIYCDHPSRYVRVWGNLDLAAAAATLGLLSCRLNGVAAAGYAVIFQPRHSYSFSWDIPLLAEGRHTIQLEWSNTAAGGRVDHFSNGAIFAETFTPRRPPAR